MAHAQSILEPTTRCPACGCNDLFVRKDFPQKLGMGLVVAAGLAFIILAYRPATFALGVCVLVAAAAVDGVLYLFVPRLMVCYRCRHELRGVSIDPARSGFDLATAEKYRKP